VASVRRLELSSARSQLREHTQSLRAERRVCHRLVEEFGQLSGLLVAAALVEDAGPLSEGGGERQPGVLSRRFTEAVTICGRAGA
jgi:hypothetical protein